MSDENTNAIETAETAILKNIANPAKSYEVDGEKTELKDPGAQLEALERFKAHKVSRNPLGAIRFFHFPGSDGRR